jgi:hypothetical protein
LSIALTSFDRLPALASDNFLKGNPTAMKPVCRMAFLAPGLSDNIGPKLLDRGEDDEQRQGRLDGQFSGGGNTV